MPVIIDEQNFKSFTAQLKYEEWKDFFTFLWETGCRVQEAVIVEAKHFQRSEERLVLPRKQAKGKKRPVSFTSTTQHWRSSKDGLLTG